MGGSTLSSASSSLVGGPLDVFQWWPSISPPPLLLLAMVVAAAAVLLTQLARSRRRHYACKFQRHMWPVVGNLPFILHHLAKGDLHDRMAEEAQACDGMTFVGGVPGAGTYEVTTANPDVVQHILKDNFDNYPKGEQFQDVMGDLLGHGIFTSDGELWKQQRKMASYEFSARSLRDLLFASVHRETKERLIPILDEACATGAAVDMQDVLLRFTFDNICQVAFGYDPHYLAPGLPHHAFAAAFDTATRISVQRALVPTGVWKAMRFFSLGWEKEMKDAVKIVHQLTDTVIATRKQQLLQQQQQQQEQEEQETQGDLDKVKHRADLLTRMMLLAPVDGQGAAPPGVSRDVFLREMCVNFIIAGRDTSAVGLTWLLWLLATHAHVQDKVLAEVREIERARAETEDKDEPLSHDELRKMTYTHAAILESLRLFPPVPYDIKHAKAEDVLPDGTRVYPGWRVGYAIYAMGRMTQLWGWDADQFKPERWIDTTGEIRAESPFKFPAFNAGPRLCLGREFAFLQMKSLTSTILRRYDLRLVPGHRVEYNVSLTLFMKHGLLMTLRKRVDVHGDQESE